MQKNRRLHITIAKNSITLHKKLTKLLEFVASAVSHNTKAPFDCLLAKNISCTWWTQQFIHDSKMAEKCRKCFVNVTLQQLIEGILVCYIRLIQPVKILGQIHFICAVNTFHTVSWEGSKASTATPLEIGLHECRQQRPVLNASSTFAIKEKLWQKICMAFGSRVHRKHCAIVIRHFFTCAHGSNGTDNTAVTIEIPSNCRITGVIEEAQCCIDS